MMALFVSALLGGLCAAAQDNNGLAPEVTDLNAEDISYAKEKGIPYLEPPFIE